MMNNSLKFEKSLTEFNTDNNAQKPNNYYDDNNNTDDNDVGGQTLNKYRCCTTTTGDSTAAARKATRRKAIMDGVRRKREVNEQTYMMVAHRRYEEGLLKEMIDRWRIL